MISINTGYGRKLSNEAKIYTDKAKYSSCNDSFIFKLAIFHDICLRADVSSEVNIKTFYTILKGLVFDNNPSNLDINNTVMHSDQIRYSICKKWIKWDIENLE